MRTYHWVTSILFGANANPGGYSGKDSPLKGGALIAQLSANEYLVTGYRARVTFGSVKGERMLLAAKAA